MPMAMSIWLLLQALLLPSHPLSLLAVNYISISHGLNNPVFKMGTMFPSAEARTVCWGEGQVWLPTCPQAVHPASRGRSCERLQVTGSSSVPAGGPSRCSSPICLRYPEGGKVSTRWTPEQAVTWLSIQPHATSNMTFRNM